MAKLSLKSTKQELLDALNEAQAQLEKKNAAPRPQPAPAAPAPAAPAPVKAAKPAPAPQPVESVFSEELTAKSDNLSLALSILEDRVVALEAMETEISALMGDIAAQKNHMLDLEAESTAARAKLEACQAAYEQTAAAAKAALDQSRVQEEENYQYSQEQARKLEADAFTDKTAQAEKKMREQDEEARRILEDLAAREEELAGLRAKLDAHPDAMAAEFARGQEEGKKAAGKEYGIQKMLAEKEHAGNIERMQLQISALEASDQEKAGRIASLEDKLDAARSSISQLSSNTVQAQSGGRIILAGDMSSSKK